MRQAFKLASVFSFSIRSVLERHSLGEVRLLQFEVVLVLDEAGFQVSFSVLVFDQVNGIEKSSMFIIKLWHLDSEGFIPPVGVWDMVEGHPGGCEAHSKKEQGELGHVGQLGS